MFLRGLAAVCDDAHRGGRPVDLIAGDFNACGRSRGFDAIGRSGAGYEIAGARRGWFRATYPAKFPLYDIDHVVCARAVETSGWELFGGDGTNHRGQFVVLRVPEGR